MFDVRAEIQEACQSTPPKRKSPAPVRRAIDNHAVTDHEENPPGRRTKARRIKNQYGEIQTLKQVARDMVKTAICGRMEELHEEILENVPDATETEHAEVSEWIEHYLARISRAL